MPGEPARETETSARFDVGHASVEDGVERTLSRYGGTVAVEVVTDAVALPSDTAERTRAGSRGPEPTEPER